MNRQTSVFKFKGVSWVIDKQTSHFQHQTSHKQLDHRSSTFEFLPQTLSGPLDHRLVEEGSGLYLVSKTPLLGIINAYIVLYIVVFVRCTR